MIVRHLLARTLAAMAVSGAALAQSADLRLVASPSHALVTPAREQVVRLTADNLSMASALGVSVSSLAPIGTANLVVRVVPSADCTASLSPVAGGVTFNWSVPALAPLASASCELGFRATATAASGSALLLFRVSAAGNADPNPSNNFAAVDVTHTMIDRPNDLRLTVLRTPGGILAPGSTHTLELVFANVGTGAHESSAALSNSYEVVSGPVLMLAQN
jgi:hypothetical protein